MTSAGVNPYSAPQSDVHQQTAQEYGSVKIFSFDGRLGRVRYIGYVMGGMLAAWLGGFLVVGVLAMLGKILLGDSAASALAITGMVAIYIAMIVFSFSLAIRRVHDFNSSGWLTLLMIVPLANMVFGILLLFLPGTEGPNRFGGKTPPNSTGVTVLAILVPVFVVVMGIVAAIAIPAYQDYVLRAKAQSHIQHQTP